MFFKNFLHFSVLIMQVFSWSFVEKMMDLWYDKIKFRGFGNENRGKGVNNCDYGAWPFGDK